MFAPDHTGELVFLLFFLLQHFTKRVTVTGRALFQINDSLCDSSPVHDWLDQSIQAEFYL